jgi:hypothetical protein
VISAVKKIGELYCYKIKFNVMDIIKGIGNFLSWMMRPIELVPVCCLSQSVAVDSPQDLMVAGNERNLQRVGHFTAWDPTPPYQPAHTTVA